MTTLRLVVALFISIQSFLSAAEVLHTNGALIWSTNYSGIGDKYTFVGYLQNTVQESHIQSMCNLFDGVSSNSVSSTYWSTVDSVNTNYARNSASALACLDLTGISPMRIYGGGGYQGYSAAVGRRYISGATHIGWWPGMQVVFFDSSGVQVIRTIVTNHACPTFTDITICVIDSDLPESIRHFKTWPNRHIWSIYPRIEAFKDDLWYGNFWKGMTFPCFGINQHGTIHVVDHYTSEQEYSDQFNAAFRQMYMTGLLSRWYPNWSYTIHEGDSSTPVFSVLGTNVIYWGGWWSSDAFGIVGAGNKPAISDVVGTNFLDPVDLSHFTFSVSTNNRPSGPSILSTIVQDQ